MKKMLIILAILLLAAACCTIWGRDTYFNLRDRKYWEELSSKISEAQIEDVILDNSVYLKGDEFSRLIMDISVSKYYRSNWRKEGPTGPIITINFKDGSTVHFGYWGNGIYETSYRRGQFLLQNTAIDAIIQKYDIDDLY